MTCTTDDFLESGATAAEVQREIQTGTGVGFVAGQNEECGAGLGLFVAERVTVYADCCCVVAAAAGLSFEAEWRFS